MLMCSYYLLRPLRDAMAIEAGLKNLPWLYVGTLAATLVLSPGFGALVARVRKALLLPLTYAFFASNLLVFYLLFKLVPDAKWLAVSFFIWVSTFNMFVVSVFWSFMVDVFRDEEAKRLFGPIAAGGGTGAILGPLLMQYLTPRIGVDAVVGLLDAVPAWHAALHPRARLLGGAPARPLRAAAGRSGRAHRRPRAVGLAAGRALALPDRHHGHHPDRLDRSGIHVQRAPALRRGELPGPREPRAVPGPRSSSRSA